MAIVESWRFCCVPLFFRGWKCAYKKTFALQRKIWLYGNVSYYAEYLAEVLVEVEGGENLKRI